jgi:hypothetical protein
MVSRYKPLAGFAAVTAALAIAVPAASASAATPTTPIVDPTVCHLLNIAMGPFGPTSLTGSASLADVLAHAGATVGCPTPAPQPSPWPTVPWWH